MQLEALEHVYVIRPKTYFYRFEGITNDQSNNLTLLSEWIHIFVWCLLFDILDNANYINHLNIHPLILMLPFIVFVLVLGFYGLVLDLMNFVLFILEPYLGTAFGLFSWEELKTFEVVASPFFQLFRLFYGHPTG